MIKEFVKNLEGRLKRPLPGAEAQKLMMPVESINSRFDLNQNNARLGGVLILFYPSDGEIYLPLTQRHDYGGTHGGQVSFPGGKWEEGDLDLEHTALRETSEEIGVNMSDIAVIGRLTDLYIPPSNFRVTPVVGFTEKKPQFNIDPYEVKELVETPLSLLVKKSTVKRKDILVRGSYSLNAPFFDIAGKTVWGATAMMLSELVEVVKELKSNL
ncbi:NUDIX hydrolase [Fulvivirga imtechensis AK7]|uniref:NUDIX hydrolase n=1 Tax=Fulvivirga imtechensis AK7 TaxID=1237149 RepID=L8JRJ0_9BACT|nr:CoA pyrophosphatase [Fulvivirga imtechensis]ELR71596.1 NUDIX hydrolase [Fulvivirga imtechensis AK7]